MERLDRVASARPARLHQVRDPENGDALRQLERVRPFRARERGVRDRRARDDGQREEAGLRGLEQADPRPGRGVEAERDGRLVGRERRMAHELVDEERVPAALPHDRLGVERAAGGDSSDELRGERAGVTRGESPDAELADLAEEPVRHRARGPVADGRDEKEERRIGRASELPEESEAVGVGPL